MQRFISTSNGAEGTNISASDEKRCAEELLKILPSDWKVSFDWAQILFSDVQYHIVKKEKIVRVVYNQNLTYWWKEVMDEIVSKLKKLKVSVA